MSRQEAAIKSAISVRELQKMPAGAIQAHPHPVPITNGTATVGVLLPIHGVPQEDMQQEDMQKVLADIRAAAATQSPEEEAAFDRLLGGGGAE